MDKIKQNTEEPKNGNIQVLEKEVENTEKETKQKNEEKEHEIKIPKYHSKLQIAVIIIISILLLILIFSTIFALVNLGNKKIIKGISIGNQDVTNLTVEEASDMLNQIVEQKKENTIIIKYGDSETPITYEALDVQFQTGDAIKEAYEVGRQGNIFKRNFEILNTYIKGKQIKLNATFDKTTIDQIIQNINNSIEGAVIQPSYYIQDDKLIIVPGKEGLKVNENLLRVEIQNSLSLTAEKEQVIEAQLISTNPEKIDIEKIHSEVYKKVQDAYYTTNPFVVYPEVDGVDFDVDNAKIIINQQKDQYEIPLIITKATKTVKDIGTEAFPDLLGTCSTNYNAGDTDRTTNLKLAAEKINGTVLLPGEQFSFNATVGERTEAAGFKMAATYSNGQVVDGLGGGICQISSTLYDAAVFANLKIVTRRNHQFVTSYLPGGKDATVVWGSQDFEFANSRKYPIRLTVTVSGGTATVQIWGVKEEVEYDITIESQKVATVPYTTEYIDDPTLPVGTEIVSQPGTNGSKYKAYKVMRLNGQIVSRTLLSTDTYNAMKRIVRVGTKTE